MLFPAGSHPFDAGKIERMVLLCIVCRWNFTHVSFEMGKPLQKCMTVLCIFAVAPRTGSVD